MSFDKIKLKLKNDWNIRPNDFWIPLHGNSTENSIYFDSNDFENLFGYAKLNKILNELNFGNVYSFDEWNQEKIYNKIEIKEYNSPDIFFTNENVDWVIYQTHEKTIAFGGSELIKKIKSEWKDVENWVNPWE